MQRKNIAADFLEFDEETQSYVKSAEQEVRDDVEKHHWLHVLRIIIKDWRLYIMLVPMILVFFFWRYLPMYELLGCFTDSSISSDDVFVRPFVGFSHFKTLLFGTGAESAISTDFWRAFKNTFLVSFYGLCFGFPMPIIIALFFNEIKSNAMRSIYQVLTYLPKFMSTVVITTLIITLFKPGSSESGSMQGIGVLSNFLGKAFGVGATVGEGGHLVYENGLLNVPDYFRAIYQVSGIWETAGYDSIVFFAAVIAVSPTSYEAAQIDGAGKMAQMRYVVLPSILSTVVIMLITKIGSLLNVGYEKTYLLTTNGNLEAAEVVSTFSVRYGFGGGSNEAKAAAAEMLNNIIGMFLVIGANTIARKASDVSLY